MKPSFWGWAIFALVAIGAILFAIAFATGYQNVSGFLWNLPVILMDFAVCAGAGLALGIQRSNRPRFKAASVAAAMLLWVLFIPALFNVDLTNLPDRWYRHVLGALVLLVSVFGIWTTAAMPLLAIEPQTRLLRILKRAAWVIWIAAAVMWVIYYFEDTYLKLDDTPIRAALVFMSAAALISMFCLFGALYLAPSQGSRAQPIQIARVFCPRCGATCDSNQFDRCTCAQCHLPIELDRREPRCACGYLLMNLNGTTCPECGKTFGARIRYELTSF